MNNNEIPLTDAVWNEWAGTLKNLYGISLPEDAILKFKTYLEELKKWNENINLISYHSDTDILWRHFTDSLIGSTLLEKYDAGNLKLKIADLGTGAGFPGFAIKIARPQYDITLVESQKKKCDFLEHLKTTLNVPGLKIINDRAEILGQNKDHREKYDIVVSRAMSKLSPNLEVSVPLVKTGGRILIYKTEDFSNELRGDPHIKEVLEILNSRIAETFNYSICETGQHFSIIVFEKTLETPLKYPRRAGIPEKRPL